jgi:inner membrane protein
MLFPFPNPIFNLPFVSKSTKLFFFFHSISIISPQDFTILFNRAGIRRPVLFPKRWNMEFIFSVIGGLILVSLLIAGIILAFFFFWRRMRNTSLSRGLPLLSPNADGATGLAVRAIIISCLILVMMLPIHMIQTLVEERMGYQYEVAGNLAAEWGQPQTLTGPILAVPFTITKQVTEKVPVTVPNSQNQENTIYREVSETRLAALTPKTLEVDGTISTEKRQRGIYSALVYSNELTVKGSFSLPSQEKFISAFPLGQIKTTIHWSQAKVIVGLSNTKAFRKVSQLNLGQSSYEFTPGTGDTEGLPQGFSAAVDLTNQTGTFDFSFQMDIAGTGWFKMAPVADDNTVKLSSSWPHPSFGGNGLPIVREVSENGFTAQWRIPALVRTYQNLSLVSSKPGPKNEDHYYDDNITVNSTIFNEYLVGVNIYEPINNYILSIKSIKFAIIFIVLTFLIFLLLEINSVKTQRRRLHPVQYGVIGLALSLFYLVLFSFSEHLGFGLAYLFATAINIAMIGGYSLATTGRRNCLVISLLLSCLYGVLYMILNLEDYALLAGTVILILATVAIMASTRKLNTLPAPISPIEMKA